MKDTRFDIESYLFKLELYGRCNPLLLLLILIEGKKLFSMATDGGSSNTRRGGRSQERSVSNASLCTVQGGDDRDGTISKCFYGVYVILHKLRTTTNSNRPFFGFPCFKVSLDCCIWIEFV
ncbi:uncharacterized protein DS421_3g69670 [Arachis hypogaea]|nr:uncharacterized protein DS421_3g69670 [Arachis hypogaea]